MDGCPSDSYGVLAHLDQATGDSTIVGRSPFLGYSGGLVGVSENVLYAMMLPERRNFVGMTQGQVYRLELNILGELVSVAPVNVRGSFLAADKNGVLFTLGNNSVIKYTPATDTTVEYDISGCIETLGFIRGIGIASFPRDTPLNLTAN